MLSDPLKSGDELPTHMPTSNVLPVTKYGAVKDAETGQELKIALDESFVKAMKEHHDTLRAESPHLHWYRIEGKRIFHTRDVVMVGLE